MADFIIDKDGNVERENILSDKILAKSENLMNIVEDIACGPIVGSAKMLYDRKKEKNLRKNDVASAIKKKACNELIPANIHECRNDYKLKGLTDETKVIASGLLQAAVTQGLIAESFSGLLQCNVDISKLAHSNDGFLRGFVVSGGGISEQAKFTEIPSVSVTPMLAFQVASFITGQYYQHVITTQLEGISKKVNQILDLMEEDDRAKLKNAFSEMSVLSKANKFSMVDLEALRSLNRLAGELREKYKSIVLNCSLDDVGRSWVCDKNEAKDWVKALDDSRFLKYMELAFGAEYLFYSTSVLLIRSELAQDKPDQGKIEGWSERIDNDIMAPYKQKYHEIKTTVCENLRLLCESSIVGADDIRGMLNHVESSFVSFEQSVVPVLSELSPSYFIEYRDGKPLLSE